MIQPNYNQYNVLCTALVMVKLGSLFYLLAFNLMALTIREIKTCNQTKQLLVEFDQSKFRRIERIRCPFQLYEKGERGEFEADSQDDRKMRCVSFFGASRSLGSNVGGLRMLPRIRQSSFRASQHQRENLKFFILDATSPLLDGFNQHFQASVHFPLTSAGDKSEQHLKLMFGNRGNRTWGGWVRSK